MRAGAAARRVTDDTERVIDKRPLPGGSFVVMGDATTSDTDAPSDEELDQRLMAVFLTQEGKTDPYPTYALLRESRAVHRLAGGMGPFITARHELCQQVLRDNRFGHSESRAGGETFGISQEDFEERFPRLGEIGDTMLGLNPPDHTRLRGLVAKAFTPRTVKELEPHIVELTDGFLDGLEGEVELMQALALRLPITVISEMLGVPRADHDLLVPHIKVAIQGLATFGPDLDRFAAIYEANMAIADYFADLVAAKRSEPDDDLLTQLIHVEEAGDTLTLPELLGTVILLFIAGYETTTNLIGNGTRALLLHPDQLEALRRDRSLLKPAIEEMLRWDSPVQATARSPLGDSLAVAGTAMQRDVQILTLLGAANRDPRVYAEADRFDITRYDAGSGPVAPPPLSFSAGIHYCLGAALARAEGHVVFDRLLDRYRTIEPAWSDDEPPVYRDNLILRGLETLPVLLAR
jgi:cytochrome P450